jgi:ketosteroid isomerase-like protein
MTSLDSQAGPILRAWFARLSESGFSSEIFLAGLAPDVVWTATGNSPVSGTFHGLAAYVAGVYRPLDERLSRWPDPVVERITAEGDRGVVEFRGEGGLGKNGCDYSMRYCWSMRVEGGLVREVIGYYDQNKVDELFADFADASNSRTAERPGW